MHALEGHPKEILVVSDSAVRPALQSAAKLEADFDVGVNLSARSPRSASPPRVGPDISSATAVRAAREFLAVLVSIG